MPSANQALNLERFRRHCSKCSLRELCLPSGLNLEDAEQIEQMVADCESLVSGDQLYHAGDRFGALYVIRAGSLKSYSISAAGELQIMGFHLPGEIIGFDAFAEQRHQCTAEALGPSRACRIPYNQLEHIADNVPGLRRQLMRLISREMQDYNAHLAMMGRAQAISRLALFLNDFSTRQARLGLSPTHLTLTMSRADLANYLGLVLETVSRLFGRLQEMGVLDVRRKKLTILDHQRLRELGDE